MEKLTNNIKFQKLELKIGKMATSSSDNTTMKNKRKYKNTGLKKVLLRMVKL